MATGWKSNGKDNREKKSNNQENVFIIFLRSGLYLMIPFIFLFGIGGIFALLMGWSISCSTKQSGAYERYDAMEAELNALILPEKTILNNTSKGVRSVRVYTMKSYKTNYPYNGLIPYYRQQLKLRGWLELREKVRDSEYEEVISYFFKKKDWKLELVKHKRKKGHPDISTPFSYGYYFALEWDR